MGSTGHIKLCGWVMVEMVTGEGERQRMEAAL